MSFLDKAKDAAAKAVDRHGEKVTGAVDKAGDLIDKRTGGKHTDKIEAGKQKARDALDKLDNKNDGLG